MCGIIGAVGSEAGSKTLHGLQTLEYRGYDSAGFGLIFSHRSENNPDKPRLVISKTVGGFSDLLKKLEKDNLGGLHFPPSTTTAIAHTRWATHGGVTDANAHPHTDCNNRFAVVHNGIIENYAELRCMLELSNHVFRSQTDTEVIAHLIEEAYAENKNFEQAALTAVTKLRGSYALLIICSDEPEKMIAVKKESPLVVSSSKQNRNAFSIAASDSLPLVKYVKKGVFLEDDDFAIVTPGSIRIFNVQTKLPIIRKETIFENIPEFSNKAGHAHYMLKEIFESPQAILNACRQDKGNLGRAVELIKKNRVIFVACGTSRHAALVGRYIFNRFNEKFCDVVVASEYPYIAESLIGKDLLVIAISQSGETADVIEGVKISKKKGAKILSITNTVGSTLDRMSDCTLFLNCGPEIGVAATKTYVAQLTLLYLLSYAMMNEQSAMINEQAFRLQKDNLKRVSEEYAKALDSCNQKIKDIARSLKKSSAVYFIARGSNFPIALEAALKFKEITYIHSEGMAAGELKHGTLALISEGTPVIAICPPDDTYDAMMSNIQETSARGAAISIFTSASISHNFYTSHSLLPPVSEYVDIEMHHVIFSPILFSGPLNLLAYYTSVELGNNPDRPRNLAKSVTVK